MAQDKGRLLNIGEECEYKEIIDQHLYLSYYIKVKDADICEIDIRIKNYAYARIPVYKGIMRNDIEYERVNKAKILGTSTFYEKELPKLIRLEDIFISKIDLMWPAGKDNHLKVFKALGMTGGEYLKYFKRKLVGKFEIEKARGVKCVCYGCDAKYNKDTNNYEVITKDGDIVISTSSVGKPKLLKIYINKIGKNVVYTFEMQAYFGEGTKYLLGYVYERTRQGKKVDKQCIDDLIELIERLDS